jgi:hypothetical protein
MKANQRTLIFICLLISVKAFCRAPLDKDLQLKSLRFFVNNIGLFNTEETNDFTQNKKGKIFYRFVDKQTSIYTAQGVFRFDKRWLLSPDSFYTVKKKFRPGVEIINTSKKVRTEADSLGLVLVIYEPLKHKNSYYVELSLYRLGWEDLYSTKLLFKFDPAKNLVNYHVLSYVH